MNKLSETERQAGVQLLSQLKMFNEAVVYFDQHIDLLFGKVLISVLTDLSKIIIGQVMLIMKTKGIAGSHRKIGLLKMITVNIILQLVQLLMKNSTIP